jgi:hypothetical protein
MAPLVIFGGAGSELYRGLGAVVIGGLLVSTVFTLVLTPALMSLMMDLQEMIGRALGRGRHVVAPAGDVGALDGNGDGRANGDGTAAGTAERPARPPV